MHCGWPTGYFTYMKNNMETALFLILSLKTCFTVIFIDFNFLFLEKIQCVPWNAALGLYPIAAAFRNSKHQVRSDHNPDLSRSRDVDGHVIIFPWYVVSYRCSIDTNPLSWTASEILNLKHIWVTTLTFRVTWRHWSCDRSITHGPFPIGVPLVLTLHILR